MTHKATTKFYSASVQDPDVPSAYYGTFGIPGEVPRWVTERGEKKVFRSADDAELAGWRVMASRLNKSAAIQEFFVMTKPAAAPGGGVGCGPRPMPVRDSSDQGFDRKPKDRIRTFRNYEPGNPVQTMIDNDPEIARVFGRKHDRPGS